MSFSDPTSDELAKQVAAALLENVNNRQQPRVIKERERMAREKLKTSSRSEAVKGAEPASSASASAYGQTPGGSLGALGRGESGELLADVVPNKYETCIPLLSGGTPIGTPLLVANDTASGEIVSRTPSASPSLTLNNGQVSTTHSMVNQYLSGSARRYSAEAVQPQYPPILQPPTGDESAEVSHLMRAVEDEKRRNRRLTSAIQVLDREVSLFRNRRQIFVTVVGFKLFNKATRSSQSHPDLPGSDGLPTSGNPALIGTDEHVEFFIVVDKSVAPKYVVRHRFNHFKTLHRMLESGQFKIPRSTSSAVAYTHDADGRTTPWQANNYYNVPTCGSYSTEDDSDSDSDDGAVAGTPNSVGHNKGFPGTPSMKRPPTSRLVRAVEMMPELPNKDRRRPSASVGGLFSKLSKKLGNKEKEGDKEKPCKTAEEAERRAARQARKAQKAERERSYKAHVCSVTGIPDEDLPFFERRAKELEVYLRQLLSIELFAECDAMSAFLTPDHPLFLEGKGKERDGMSTAAKEGSVPSLSRSGSEGSLAQKGYATMASTTSSQHLLAPPSASQTGRISPGGDFIMSGANLAILMGETIVEPTPQPAPAGVPHVALQGYCAAPRMTPGHTPTTTPYVSQGLPSHQQALAIAQQHNQQLQGGVQSFPTGSGPLDAQFPQQQQAQPRKPAVRTDKKAVMTLLGGKGSQRFTPAQGMTGQAGAAEFSPVAAPVATRPPTSQVDLSTTPSPLPPAALAQAQLPTMQPTPSLHHLVVRPSPSPVPSHTRPVSPFTALFGAYDTHHSSGGGHPYTNPNVVAFNTLVIAPDELRSIPAVLGSDAVADHREQRQRERGCAYPNMLHTPSSSSRTQFTDGSTGGSATHSNSGIHPTAAAPRHMSRNGNFLLLLSALGFNQVPVYSTAGAGVIVPSTAVHSSSSYPAVVESNPLYSGSIHSNRSLTSKASAVSPMRGGTAGNGKAGSDLPPPVGTSSQFATPPYLGTAIAPTTFATRTSDATARGTSGIDDFGTDDGSSSGLPSSGLPSNMSIK